ncbi:very short patch repair endonuclease [Variovorax sp. J22R133]|uniref:very short patch repair endonuclease n=1 Tax=Variovorax brevis TaxID=3053503 RepID=UPI002576DAD2|nr:very short patch repair endonuclease [Variovorax sp. J22R133]MDM0114922.1 very short patch repair endonuclease [Variovorax sp. J22R133]
MTDVVSREVRSRMMSGIRSRNTKPEVTLRSVLHARGFRFRIHRKDLPGRPDIVLPRYRAIIQVHGCFWHGHGCEFFRYPATNPDFWREKIAQNRARDERTTEALKVLGWRVLTVWECAVRGSDRETLADAVTGWIVSGKAGGELGKNGHGVAPAGADGDP